MTAPPTAARILRALEAENITHVIGLPDNATAPLFALLMGHPRIRSLRITREGEAFAVAAGLWLGGRNPVVIVQNTGFLESGDALRGTAVRMGVPLVILLGCRGIATLAATDSRRAASRETLVRADVDSVALLTEPTLHAWGIPFETYAGDDDARRLTGAFDRARREERPVVVLLPRSLV